MQTQKRRVSPERLRFAFGSCQHYEKGYYSAYRHMIADELDLVIHLGDYIYEGKGSGVRVRQHAGPEPVTLENYRNRYAQYKSDEDLQAAHAAAPWLVTWDDHEVDNDYADLASEELHPEAWFRRRRTAAYRAYYEHMPLRRSATPLGEHLRLYTEVGYGELARFQVLDDRQYRTPQVTYSHSGLRPRLIGYGAERAKRFHTEIARRLESVPGVESVGYARGWLQSVIG